MGLVVLREDARRLRGLPLARGGEANREIAQLVVCHEEREAQTLLVVDAPLPLAAHVVVRERDGLADERLDGLRHRRDWCLRDAHSASSGTPVTVSAATESTTAWRCPVCL